MLSTGSSLTTIAVSYTHLDVYKRQEISFSLVIPEEIQELNAEYRNIDKETDVLSFPMLEFPEDEDMLTYETGIPVMLGDIVISTTRAAEQAEAYGHSLEREICYLSVHSVLPVSYTHLDVYKRQ